MRHKSWLTPILESLWWVLFDIIRCVFVSCCRMRHLVDYL